MTNNRRPVCFIAMAFGREDSDTVYENMILPILKQNNVTPIIINRQQSNDDLNFQIIEQLERADFCIADLTYTRPSVYFEAGYAQRSIPVIYTVRKDHLAKGQPEDLRVHFDLQAKPIIDWKSPNDQSFVERLEKRLRATVLRDWTREQKLRDSEADSIRSFGIMSLNTRLTELRRGTLYKMRRLGIGLSSWEIAGINSNLYNNVKIPRKKIIAGQENYIAGRIIKGRKLHTVSIQSYDSITNTELRRLHEFYGRISYPISIFNKDIYKFDKIISSTLVISLKPLSAHQIERVLTTYMVVDKAKTYVRSEELNVETHSVHRFSFFFFLTGVQSFPHFHSMLDDTITGLEELSKSHGIT